MDEHNPSESAHNKHVDHKSPAHKHEAHKSSKKNDTIEISISRNAIVGIVAAIALIGVGVFGYQSMNSGESKTSATNTPDVATQEDSLVTLTILGDKTCTVCDTTAIVASLGKLFTNFDVKTLDISSTEGKALAQKIDAKSIPVYLFDASVAESNSYAQIQKYLVASGDSYVLKVGGDKKLIGRTPSKTAQVDLFVMSHCPYGTRAELNMKEVMANFDGQVKMNLYFIANENGENFSSLHGQPEVDEDIRQMCIIDQASEKLIDYLSCVDEDISNVDTKWEQCATDAGINPTNVKDCVESGKGADLLRENIKVANTLGVSGSPGFLINNQVLAGGLRDSEQIKQMICGENPGLSGCDNTLSGGSDVSGSC